MSAGDVRKAIWMTAGERFRRAQDALRTLASRGRKPPTPVERGAPSLRLVDRVELGGENPREGKIQEVRERIADGYYDRPEIRETLIRSLLRSFGERE